MANEEKKKKLYTYMADSLQVMVFHSTDGSECSSKDMI
jgi:hypothetical protein